MKYRLPAIAIVVLAVGIVSWFIVAHNRSSARARAAGAELKMEEVRQVPEEPSVADSTDSKAEEETALTATPPEPAGPVPTPKRVILASATPEAIAGPEMEPGLSPLTVLENTRAVFRQYAQRFGGNPVGINREITAMLNGKNPGQAVLVNPEDGLRINDRGELVDNWGTPFFFHQLSRTEMEIYSAGPDRKMWTRDDLVIR